MCCTRLHLQCLPTEHSNYFGTDDKLGVVAVSVRREKLDDTKELKDQYQYRLIIRTSEVAKHATAALVLGGGVGGTLAVYDQA